MPSRHAPQRLIAALLLPLFFLAGTGSASAMFRCKYDGVARKACCCPKPEEPSEEQAALRKSCCCDVETITAAGTAETRTLVERLDLSKLYEVLVVAFSGAFDSAQGVVVARALFLDTHPPPRPPLFLLKHSLLI